LSLVLQLFGHNIWLTHLIGEELIAIKWLSRAGQNFEQCGQVKILRESTQKNEEKDRKGRWSKTAGKTRWQLTFQDTAALCGWSNRGASPFVCNHHRFCQRRDTTEMEVEAKNVQVSESRKRNVMVAKFLPQRPVWVQPRSK
jgi:hypothetical protein